MKPEINIVILAAGLGTRMRSRRAKVLHRAGGLTLIEHAVNTAMKITPPERITVVVGHQAEQVREALGSLPVSFVQQTEQKGTGHALLVCRGSLQTRPGFVAVMYGDGPLLSEATLRRLIETEIAQHRANPRVAATLITTILPDPTGYGRVLRDEEGYVTQVIEEKPATAEQRKLKLVNSGIYCFEAAALWKHIGEIVPNAASGEYYLTDMPEIFYAAGLRVVPVHVEDTTELHGINTRVELAAVYRIFRDRKVLDAMLSGVTVEKPETVSIDVNARIGMDTVVGPFAQILGNTVIGENCRIGACSIVKDCELADGVVIEPFTSLADSRVEGGAHIGPFARLRMNNVVGEGAHIGNFVELKKTHLGAGAKASHLTYLGDSEVGENVNIGAGTITCNYDGIRKHQTRVGPGAFVGSNSTLVAPVEVGAGAYVGAGSVITEVVPPEALALGRGRQVVKEGWVGRKRAKK